MAAETSMFHWADYVTFSLSLVVSIAVGIYYGMFNKREANVEEFFLGGRDLAVVPVAISLFISWFSALSFLGDPVEVYYYGAVYWYSGLGYVLGLLPIIFYFAARYQKMKYVSACEVNLHISNPLIVCFVLKIYIKIFLILFTYIIYMYYL